MFALRAAAEEAERAICSSGLDGLPEGGVDGPTLHDAMVDAETHRPVSGSLRMPDPLLPDPDAPTDFIWPSSTGPAILRMLWTEHATRRNTVYGRRDGDRFSGAIVYQAANWCLKTSITRCFADIAEAREAFVTLVHRKQLLGDLRAPNTVLSLQTDFNGYTWVWTVTPWFATLHSLLEFTREQGDSEARTVLFNTYARAVATAVELAAKHNIVLDLHPSNFAVDSGRLLYLDDDIRDGTRLGSLQTALIETIRPYGAMEEYLSILDETVLRSLSHDDPHRCEIARLVEHERELLGHYHPDAVTR